jgi:hypothetical protein
MNDQPPSDRFKTEMPHIPGVSEPAPAPRATGGNPAVKLFGALFAALLVIFLAGRWALRSTNVQPKTEAQPQIEVPAPAPDPNTLLPHATDDAPGIAGIAEMAKPWSTKEFYVRNGLTGEDVPALLVRLPIGSASQSTGYWAFSTNSPYEHCKLEFVADLEKLKSDYGFRRANHPMVGNPCTQTLFDPLKTINLPGSGAWVRGGIVQGSDLRPPMGVEIRVRGKDIQAIRVE